MRKNTLIKWTAFVMTLILSLSVVLSALAYSTIPFGEQSDRVRVMQNQLKRKGYYSGAVDGKFGPATKKAVIKYQTAIGIKADGKPGDRTLTALYEGVSAINQDRNSERKYNAQPTNPRTLYYGCSGTRVCNLQKALREVGCYKGAIDGQFGDLVYEAVCMYQRQKGLKVDGMAGTKTLASLNKNAKTTIGSGFVLDVGSKGQEVDKVAYYLRTLGYEVPSTGKKYTEELANVVKSWQWDTGRKATGTVTESQYNAMVIELQ